MFSKLVSNLLLGCHLLFFRPFIYFPFDLVSEKTNFFVVVVRFGSISNAQNSLFHTILNARVCVCVMAYNHHSMGELRTANHKLGSIFSISICLLHCTCILSLKLSKAKQLKEEKRAKRARKIV